MVNSTRVERVYSDNLKDVCQVTCSICSFRSTRQGFYSHWQTTHKDAAKGTENSFVYSKLVYHKCKLCIDHHMLHDVICISEHLKRKHPGITLNDYKTDFLDAKPLKRKLDEVIEIDVSEADSKKVKGEIKEEEVNNEEWESINFDDNSDLPYETNDVHKMCLARCNMCSKITLLHHIQVHLYNQHGIVYKDPQERNKTRFQIVRQTYYRCRLCWKLLLFSFHPLYVHLRDEHYMGLGDYKEMYMGFKKDVYLYTKPSNKLKDDKENDDKSSLRELIGNGDSGKEGLLENNQHSVQHNPDSVQQFSQTAGEIHAIEDSYACPIDGCTSKMDPNGMKDGSAANHMILVHKMRPYRMKKLNLMWKKIE